MMFSSTAYVASSRVAPVVPVISFNRRTSTCTAFIYAEQMTDDIDAVIKSWQGSRCIKTWEESSVGDLAFSGVLSNSDFKLDEERCIPMQSASQFMSAFIQKEKRCFV